jgi:hypothetical protein
MQTGIGTTVAASDPTAVPEGVPQDAVDELYGLPIDEFTPRRDALAKELRGGGKRDAAAWVKGLRKPSAAAWIVNQLARTRARQAKDLLAAGEALGAAHERVVAGEAGADELRAAAAAEHEAAQALAADAPGFLDRDGHPPSGPTLEKVAETIRAVALDDEARAGFEKGRLTRERSASGFGPLGAPPPASRGEPARRKQGGRGRKPPGKAKPAASARGTGSKAKPAARGGGRKGSEPKPAARAAARKALAKAKTDQRARARDVKAAERELATARREAERAQRRLERATADLEEARAREADARSRISDAEALAG